MCCQYVKTLHQRQIYLCIMNEPSYISEIQETRIVHVGLTMLWSKFYDHLKLKKQKKTLPTKSPSSCMTNHKFVTSRKITHIHKLFLNIFFKGWRILKNQRKVELCSTMLYWGVIVLNICPNLPCEGCTPKSVTIKIS